MSIYQASPIRRRRATKQEMEERAQFLIERAEALKPITVRGLYYQAESAGLPGIGKDEASYNKVQTQVLKLRREGRLPYGWIADATRWARKPQSWNSVKDALEQTARLYRRNLWQHADEVVEVWCEKDALAGTIYPVTAEYDVSLMVTRGFSSETFAYESVEAYADDDRPLHVYYLGDFDRAGHDAGQSLQEKLHRFGDEFDVATEFHWVAVTEDQIVEFGLPTRQPKRKSPADKAWPYDVATELDAIPPNVLRALVRERLEQHLPADQLEVLKIAEQSEREALTFWAGDVAEEVGL